MSNLTILLSEHLGPRPAGQLLLLAKAKADLDQAEWLAGCIEPLASELQAEIDRLAPAIETAKAALDQARAKAETALADWEAIAGQSQPDELALATAKVEAVQAADAAFQNLQAEKRRLVEAERRLDRVTRLLGSLASIEPPRASDVKAIARAVLLS